MLKTLSVALLLGIAAMTQATIPAHAQEERAPLRTIAVNGHGEVMVVPDLAQISLGVTTGAATAREALDANSAAMTALFDLLKAEGFEPRDMATSNFSVGPRYNYDNNNSGVPPKVVGYDVSNMVTLTVRDLTKLGAVLDKAVTAGSNQINGISFTVADPEPKLDDARRAAIRDARRKADVYAAASGATLGDIISINEGAVNNPPVPVAYAGKAERAMAVPIAQGEQALSVDVSVVFALK